MCAQCAAESWERSRRPRDVNSQHHSVSWPAERRKHYLGFYNRPCDRQMELTVKLWDNMCVISFFIHILMMINKPHFSRLLWGHPSPDTDMKSGVNCHFFSTPPPPHFSIFFHPLTFPVSISLPPFISFISPTYHSLSLNLPPSLIFTQACYTRVQASQIERERARERESSGGKWVTDTINSQEHSQLRLSGTQID